jgi:hypothetical protein
MYAPGHDAKDVARWVRNTIQAMEQDRVDAPAFMVWKHAIEQLPTFALQAKYRRSMIASANKHLGHAIQAMNNSDWQRRSHLQYMLAQYDRYFAVRSFSADYLASVAAAMGMTARSINYRNS